MEYIFRVKIFCINIFRTFRWGPRWWARSHICTRVQYWKYEICTPSLSQSNRLYFRSNDKFVYLSCVIFCKILFKRWLFIGSTNGRCKRFYGNLRKFPMVNPVNNHLVNNNLVKCYATQIKKYTHKTTLTLLLLILFHRTIYWRG